MAKQELPDGNRYSGGGYSVMVKVNGAILVQSGDSLSKYSMAIHGNFNFINEYKHRRHKPSGSISSKELQEIPDKNLINAGETLYHVPTLKEFEKKPGKKPDRDSKKGEWNVVGREDFLNRIHSISATVRIQDFGVLKAGQAYASKNGRRTIVSLVTGVSAVIYLLENPSNPNNNKLIIQKIEQFVIEVKNHYIDDLSRRVEPIKYMLETEVRFFLGLVSCTGFVGFMAVTSLSAIEWVITNWTWLLKVNDAIYITCEVHFFLSNNYPVLYEKLIYQTLHILLQNVVNVKGNILQSIANDPKLVGYGSGVIVGNLLFKVAKGRFAAIAAVCSIIFTIIMKAIQSIPGAIVLTAKEKQDYGAEIVKILRAQGVNISEDEAEKIIDETLEDPEVLKAHIEKLKIAFDLIK